jgi:2-phospho-L-lactate/phosphoenolpyruvate guanylyltransferase
MNPPTPGVTPSRADLTRTVALVPVRHLERAKTRLGDALDAEERTALVRRFLDVTLAALAAVRDAGAIETIVVASADPEALGAAVAARATVLPVPGRDLVEDLTTAREVARAMGATAVLVVPIDLPAIGTVQVAEILGQVATASAAARAAGRGLVLLVPDIRGDGTNLLLLSPPDVIAFAFGPGSRGRHVAAAAVAGAVCVEAPGPLSLDVDTPDDLMAAAAARGT